MHPLELIPGLTFIRPNQRGLHERGGKFQSVFKDGVNFYIPVYDQVRKVNITEQSVNINPSDMITKDNLNAEVDLVVYYQVRKNAADVKKSQYNVEDYEKQITSLAQTTARNVIGTMSFEEVNSKRAKLNTKLQDELDTETEKWGIEVVRVEMEEITPPSDVQNSMNEIIKAENEKDAAEDFANARETEADGERRAEIKKAKGKKQAAILEAEGKAKAIEKEAKAQAKEIELVNTSIDSYFSERPQVYKKLETTVSSLQNGSKYILGTDKPITTVLNESGDITPYDKQDKEGQEDMDIDMSDMAEKMTDEVEEVKQ